MRDRRPFDKGSTEKLARMHDLVLPPLSAELDRIMYLSRAASPLERVNAK